MDDQITKLEETLAQIREIHLNENIPFDEAVLKDFEETKNFIQENLSEDSQIERRDFLLNELWIYCGETIANYLETSNPKVTLVLQEIFKNISSNTDKLHEYKNEAKSNFDEKLAKVKEELDNLVNKESLDTQEVTTACEKILETLDSLEHLKVQNEVLGNDLESKKNEIFKKEKEIQKLKEENKKFKESQAELESFTKQVSSIEDQLESQEVLIKEYQEQIQTITKEKEELQHSQSTQESQRVSELEAENSNLLTEIENYKQKLENYSKKNSHLEERINELSQRKPDAELLNQIESLQEENRTYLKKIVSLSKEAADQSVAPTYTEKLKSQSRKTLKRSKSMRELSLKQLKEIIEDIYSSKLKFDEKCYESKQPRETMEQYLYTYLNHKYGLKSLIQDWAASITNSIQKYEETDAEVAFFARVMRNELDEDFKQVITRIKESTRQLLRSYIQSKYPLMRGSELKTTLKDKLEGSLLQDEWCAIVDAIFSEEESDYIKQQIGEIIEKKTGKPFSNSRNKPSKQKTAATYCEVLDVIISYDMLTHESLLKPFREKFSSIDEDNDGVLDEKEFKELCASIELLELGDFFLEKVDPFSSGVITFGECVRVFNEHCYPQTEETIIHYLFNQHHDQTFTED